MQLPPSILQALSRACSRDLSQFDEAFLRKSLDKRLSALSLDTAEAYLARLAEDSAEAPAFSGTLNISYSEFFRNSLNWALLEHAVLPGLVERMPSSGRAEIRIWSAACAAGQEAYSIALLIDELASSGSRPIPCRIFATDIVESELAAARRGVYGAASVQNVRVKHLDAYFTRAGDTYTVMPRLREQIDFSMYDLLDGRSTCPPASIFGDFGIIMCSNVLLYYRPDVRKSILSKVRSSLAPGGYLVTGEAERGIVEWAGGFVPIDAAGSVFRAAR